MPYIPHTELDKQEMLKAIGVDSTEALFDEIPKRLQYHKLSTIPAALNEMGLLKEAQQLASINQNGLCFMGAGSYEHHIPALVWDIASRGEFLTAYTPYQAEVSQGTLQLLYEYQTMIAELTGMQVANASLYDGASALAEAILMAVRIKRCFKVLIPQTLHPLYKDTIETIVGAQNIELIILPMDNRLGTIDCQQLSQTDTTKIAALVIAQPNFFGCLEAVDDLTNWAHQHQLLTIGCVNPISLGLLKPPGQWGEQGADIVCGEGQPLGCPMASGGPYFGFFSTKMEYIRQLPGRLIGKTVDKEGNIGFSLTLQAREQHIRRGKATSNICTNQGLLVTAATVYLSLMGATGLKQTALQCHSHTQLLLEKLLTLPQISQVFRGAFFHEVLIKFNQPIEAIVTELQNQGILAGVIVAPYFSELSQCLLICVTEMRTMEDINYYVQTLTKLLTA